jgi:hypothetical protein
LDSVVACGAVRQQDLVAPLDADFSFFGGRGSLYHNQYRHHHYLYQTRQHRGAPVKGKRRKGKHGMGKAASRLAGRVRASMLSRLTNWAGMTGSRGYAARQHRVLYDFDERRLERPFLATSNDYENLPLSGWDAENQKLQWSRTPSMEQQKSDKRCSKVVHRSLDRNDLTEYHTRGSTGAISYDYDDDGWDWSCDADDTDFETW